MARYIIQGGTPLNGSIQIAGRKNSALKILAATVLTTGTTTIKNLPNISDVRVMIQILTSLGAEVHYNQTTATISTANINSSVIPTDLGEKLRASLVLVGPLLARFGKVTFPHPGGCVIGKRTIDPHIEGFRRLGATVDFDGDHYTVTGPLSSAEIYLTEKSVTGTENLLMAACGVNGSTSIVNAAEEEHIIQLTHYLQSLGYSVSGPNASTYQVQSNGEISHSDAKITIIPDEIEVGTFAIAALVTGGDLQLKGVGKKFGILPLLSKFDAIGADYHYDADTESLRIKPSPLMHATDVQTNPFPGFFPDLQSPFVVLATQLDGDSLIHDWMYEGRLSIADQLLAMGADITRVDVHRVIVHGPTALSGSSHASTDLRGGASLVLAALCASGESTVENIELIERGYVDFVERLQSVGAKIIREDD